MSGNEKFVLNSATIQFNVVFVVVSALVVCATALQGQEFVDAYPWLGPVLTSIVTIGNIILRFKTTKPITTKRGK